MIYGMDLTSLSTENWGKMDVYAIGLIILRLFEIKINDIC